MIFSYSFGWVFWVVNTIIGNNGSMVHMLWWRVS
jgi:hypothetical protein